MREWLPTLSVVVTKAAWPPAFKGTWARTLVPSKKATMPPGVPDPVGAEIDVAVNVTASATPEGLGEDVRVVDDALR